MKQKKTFWILTFITICSFCCFFIATLKLINTNRIYEENNFIKASTCLNLFNSVDNFENLNNTINSSQIKEEDIKIKLIYKNKIYYLLPHLLEAKSHTVKDFKYKSTRRLNHKNIIKVITKIRKMKFSDEVAFNYILAPLKSQIEQIKNSINTDAVNAEIYFDKTCNCFITKNSINGIQIDEQRLYKDVLDALLKTNNVEIEIKTNSVEAQISKEKILKSSTKQSTFSTYFGQSNSDRKNNIKLACNALHGYEIKPGQIFSFNEAIGKRCPENGYKEANIIKDGQFVKGVGGGVCQVSTTLYNALLLANIKPIEVHKHSLPVSYVKPALDAMVSWSTADLKFKNTTDLPIFITSHCNDSNLTFSIYGNTKDSNTKIKTVSQIIKTIPHKGDKIVPDTQGKYADKIMFKGEFIREKSPKDGYIAHAYIDTYKDGVLVNHELIREVMYEPQLGLVYEGTETLPEGMTIPNNS